jgi:galactonate dehydratase
VEEELTREALAYEVRNIRIGTGRIVRVSLCGPGVIRAGFNKRTETFGGFHAELLKDPIDWKNGYIIPSRRPGLGYELNESAVRRYAL